MKFVEFLKETRELVPPLSDQYGDWLGYKIDSYNIHGKIVMTMLKIRQDHLSPSTAVHGGVITGFLDFSCGCAAFLAIAKDQLCSTVDLNVKFFKPLKEADEIVCKAQVVHQGRTLCTVSAQVHVKSSPDIFVAMALGTFNIYKLKM